MTYNSKIRDSRNKAYDHHIATKILDLMDKLRLDNEQNSARRWIWELLQNAKDVVQENSGVTIDIDFYTFEDQGYLTFSHNGRPFSIDNITFLIEQVSTKERKKGEGIKPKTTGKFGTGFLTTHLLSEVVDVYGVVKEPDLPYRKFALQLDRTGREIDMIIDSVNRSLAILDHIDSQQEYTEFSEFALNTTFKYQLDKNGVTVANAGLNDLTGSLPYTLIFIPEIKNVKLKFQNIEYLVQSAPVNIDNLQIHTVTKTASLQSELIRIAVFTEDGVSIAIPVEVSNVDTISIVELDTDLPKIFCDFPLVGSEGILIPFIINSSSFNPNEPRSGVYLTDKNDPQIHENKEIFKTAVNLFLRLIEIAARNSWGNVHLLAKIKAPTKLDWLSPTWFHEEVFWPIVKKLQTTPIIETVSGDRKAIKNPEGKDAVWFPYGLNAELRTKVWRLASKWIPNMIPVQERVEFWNDFIWNDCAMLKLETIAASIVRVQNLDSLSRMLQSDNETSVQWLNEYYSIVNFEAVFINEIIADKYSIIPNQNGVFKKKSHLNQDEQIEEELKNCLKILNIDCRDYLVHHGANTGPLIQYGTKTQQYIIDEINRVIKEGKNPKIFDACSYLTSLFSSDSSFPKKRKEVFNFFQVIYPHTPLLERSLTTWSENIWIDSDRLIMKWFVSIIAKQKNIDAFVNYAVFMEKNAAINWLDKFVKFLVLNDFENLINLKTSPILPNQNGDFMVKDDLFLDGEIDERLKDICADLGYDFRNELLATNLYLELPANRTKTEFNVAEEIIRLITPRFSEFPRLQVTKQIFKKLYLWFSDKKEEARKLFGELYVNKHKLFDDDEIAQNIQRSEVFDDLMEEFGISDIDRLRDILKSANNTAPISTSNGDIITQDILVSLGISSIRELEDALKDHDLAARFAHSVTPTIEMFKHAHELIERAKINIINYLDKDSQYDITGIEPIATTVLAGVKKNNLPINIVTRPSDNGEVIIYYNSEKDTLDYTNSELWIDNGIDNPQHLTLGRILKTTGITRIPV